MWRLKNGFTLTLALCYVNIVKLVAPHISKNNINVWLSFLLYLHYAFICSHVSFRRYFDLPLHRRAARLIDFPIPRRYISIYIKISVNAVTLRGILALLWAIDISTWTVWRKYNAFIIIIKLWLLKSNQVTYFILT